MITNPSVRKWSPTAQPASGPRFAAVHKGHRHPVETVVEFTEYDRSRRKGSVSTMSGVEVRGALTFEPSGTGTRKRWAWDVRPSGFAKVAAPLVTVIGRRQERACWNGLKRHLESGSAEAASND
jgi:hypothetical protein